MALQTLGDMKGEVLVRLGASTTLAYYTDTILGDWLNDAYMWASSYKKFPMTEGRVSTTFATGAGTNSDEYSFEGYKADSFRFIKVGTERFQKINFEDYQNYLEENPQGSDKIYSDYGRLVYINPNSGVTGTLVAYGQYTPAPMDKSVPGETTIFSGYEEEGNEAIVSEAMSYAMLREKRPTEATYYHQRAVDSLENLNKRTEGEQAMYQTKNRGIWERFDVVGGDYYNDIIKRDQF